MESNFKYFTMQFFLHNPLVQGGPDHFSFKNLEANQVTKYRDEMFLTGIRIQHTSRSWEIVSPFNIKRVLLIGQEEKM
jgi:hypothetical protein